MSCRSRTSRLAFDDVSYTEPQRDSSLRRTEAHPNDAVEVASSCNDAPSYNQNSAPYYMKMRSARVVTTSNAIVQVRCNASTQGGTWVRRRQGLAFRRRAGRHPSQRIVRATRKPFVIRSKSTASGRVTRRASSDPACFLPCHVGERSASQRDVGPATGDGVVADGQSAFGAIYAPNGGCLT